MTSTLTKTEAAALRSARHVDMKLLARKTKAELVAIHQSEAGMPSPYGHWAKNDLLTAILDIRFPPARQDEANHVLFHGDASSSACPHCRCQEIWTAPSDMAPGRDQLVQCGLAPGHEGAHQ